MNYNELLDCMYDLHDDLEDSDFNKKNPKLVKFFSDIADKIITINKDEELAGESFMGLKAMITKSIEQVSALPKYNPGFETADLATTLKRLADCDYKSEEKANIMKELENQITSMPKKNTRSR